MLQQQTGSTCVDAKQDLQQLPVQLRINIMPHKLQSDQVPVQVSSCMPTHQHQQQLEHVQQWMAPSNNMQQVQQPAQQYHVMQQQASSDWGISALHSHEHGAGYAFWPGSSQQQRQQADGQLQGQMQQPAHQQIHQQQPSMGPQQQQLQQQQPQQQQQQERQQSHQQQVQHNPGSDVHVTPMQTAQQQSRLQGTPPAAVLAASPGSAPGHSARPASASPSPMSAPPVGMYSWPAGYFSPPGCWSVPTAEQFAAMSAAAAAHSTASLHSSSSLGNLGIVNVVKKYKRAKSLLQVSLTCCTLEIIASKIRRASNSRLCRCGVALDHARTQHVALSGLKHTSTLCCGLDCRHSCKRHSGSSRLWTLSAKRRLQQPCMPKHWRRSWQPAQQQCRRPSEHSSNCSSRLVTYTVDSCSRCC